MQVCSILYPKQDSVLTALQYHVAAACFTYALAVTLLSQRPTPYLIYIQHCIAHRHVILHHMTAP